jgi:acyl-CoA thioester hydrolase
MPASRAPVLYGYDSRRVAFVQDSAPVVRHDRVLPAPAHPTKGCPMKTASRAPPVVTYRGSCCARQPEAHGALNPHGLIGRFEEATWQLLARLGYGPRRMANERRGLMAQEQRIVQIEEPRAAAVLHVESDLLELGPTRLRCLHRMCDSESLRTLSTMELTFVLTGIDEGSGTALPPDLIQRALAVFPQLQRTAPMRLATPCETADLPI